MIRRLLASVCCLSLLASGAAAEDPLPAPFPDGVSLGHRLCETIVNGPGAGKQRSLICDLAGRPAALIYVRDLDPAVEKLLKKLDANAQWGKEQKMGLACVLLSMKDDDKKKLEDLDARLKLQRTTLAMHGPLDDGIYFGTNPRGHRLPADAAVTVVVFQKLKVQSSFAFRKGELTDEKITILGNALTRLLPAMKI